MAEPDLESVERQVRIAARPDTVFRFLIDPDRMLRWMGSGVALDPRPGGIYRVDVNGRDVARGEFVEVVPPSRVVFTFGWEGGGPLPPGSTTVEISLEPDGEGTIVRLRHSGLPREAREQHAQGWEHYLGRLAIAVGGGDPGPDPLAAPGSMGG